MPYLWRAAITAHKEGIPVMRAMVLEFEKDRMCQYLDKQYMLGDSLLVAPIFNEEGMGEFYLPDIPEGGRWTEFFTGRPQQGGSWYREHYDYCSIPLFVRPNTILPLGAVDDTPEYDHSKDVTLRIYELTGEARVIICDQQGKPSLEARAVRKEHSIVIEVEAGQEYRIELINLQAKAVEGAEMTVEGQNTILRQCVKNGCIHVSLG